MGAGWGRRGGNRPSNWAGLVRRGKGFPGQDPAKDVAISLRAGLYWAPWLAARLSDFLPSRKPQREVRWEPRNPISLESHRSSLLGCLPVRGPLERRSAGISKSPSENSALAAGRRLAGLQGSINY